MSQVAVDPKFVSYVWTISCNGSLYARNSLSPIKVGKIVNVSWTKKYKCAQLTQQVPAFKLAVDTSTTNTVSQDVDSSMEVTHTETYVVQESLYRGVASFNATGTTAQVRVNAEVDQAFQNGPLAKQGMWLKNWFNTNMAQTDIDNEGSSLASTMLVNSSPSAFGPSIEGIVVVMFLLFRIVLLVVVRIMNYVIDIYVQTYEIIKTEYHRYLRLSPRIYI